MVTEVDIHGLGETSIGVAVKPVRFMAIGVASVRLPRRKEREKEREKERAKERVRLTRCHSNHYKESAEKRRRRLTCFDKCIGSRWGLKFPFRIIPNRTAYKKLKR